MNFGGDEVKNTDFDDANVVILPIRYEHAMSYGTGAGQGAYHLLAASAQLEDLDAETCVNWTQFSMHTADFLDPPDDPEQAVAVIKDAAKTILSQNKFLLSVGGDHSVTIGLVMAASALHPDIGVLQVDAHADLRNEWNDSRYNHACVMRRVVEDMRLPIAQVGIRSFSSGEAVFIKEKGLSPFYAHQIDPNDDSWMDRALDALPEKIYVTIDLDGLDPSVIPGTGTPEPGGLSYRQLVRLIQKAGNKKTVIAADITELAKIGGTQVSEFAAAKIATKIMIALPRILQPA